MGLLVHHHRLGVVESTVVSADNAVKEYDERLFLDIHPETRDYVIMIEMERPAPPYPIMGLGPYLPSRDEIIKRLRMSDSKREDIRKQVNDANKLRAAEGDHIVRENVAAGAELAEYIARKEGRVSEYKSYAKPKRNDGH